MHNMFSFEEKFVRSFISGYNKIYITLLANKTQYFVCLVINLKISISWESKITEDFTRSLVRLGSSNIVAEIKNENPARFQVWLITHFDDLPMIMDYKKWIDFLMPLIPNYRIYKSMYSLISLKGRSDKANWIIKTCDLWFVRPMRGYYIVFSHLLIIVFDETLRRLDLLFTQQFPHFSLLTFLFIEFPISHRLQKSVCFKFFHILSTWGVLKYLW